MFFTGIGPQDTNITLHRSSNNSSRTAQSPLIKFTFMTDLQGNLHSPSSASYSKNTPLFKKKITNRQRILQLLCDKIPAEALDSIWYGISPVPKRPQLCKGTEEIFEKAITEEEFNSVIAITPTST